MPTRPDGHGHPTRPSPRGNGRTHPRPIALCAAAVILLAAPGVRAASYVWAGGASTLWSDAANWVAGGAGATLPPGAGDAVTLPNATSNRATVMDIALGTGRFAGLTIEQSTGGVTQTLQLQEPILLSTSVPSFNITAGQLALDVGDQAVDWRVDGVSVTGRTTIPGGTKITLDGGYLGFPSGTGVWADNSGMDMLSGSEIAGTGIINPSFSPFRLREGATLSVGDGALEVQIGYFLPANLFVWEGRIEGNGTTSVFSLGGLTAGHNQRINQTATPGPNAELEGIVEFWAAITDDAYENTFGRFPDPDKINFRDTQFAIEPNTWSWKWNWEAQTTLAGLRAHGADAPFKLGSYFESDDFGHNHHGRLKLVDSSSDGQLYFAYIGQLLNLGGAAFPDDGIDLNGIALLTDMDSATLAGYVAGGYIFNSGPGGAPTVRNLVMGNTTYWYVAPAGVLLPEPSGGLLLAAAAALAASRRRARPRMATCGRA
ncbi:MAG: hypothetical protein BWZ02_02833 [Lentisphaerae bacterium ADurb.BinA184]|nr:MAG: hypothetical protein BWZ02_02833 [Lentisphaerae bacterium ADurb.BinA184]